MMRTIKLTEEQANLLEDLLLHELDDEFIYEMENDKNPSYYEEVLNLFKAVYRPSATILFGNSSVIQAREDELKQIKGER